MAKKSYSKWFAKLLRRKKPQNTAVDPPRKSYTDEFSADIVADPNKHAIAVAAATAAVAEAALAAAKAAAEVVRLTSRRGSDISLRRWSLDDYSAAVRIQSAFRGYLARRALKALKGLVKLQALVRGHFVRKRSTDMLRRMQAMVRLQARARANRLHSIETTYHIPERNRKLDHSVCSLKLNESFLLKRCGSVSSTREVNPHTARANPSASWLESRTEDCSRASSHNSLSRTVHVENEEADKILEIDSWRPHLAPIIKRNYPSHETYPKYPVNHNVQSRSPCNSESVVTLRSLNLPPMEHDFSPQACSVPSRPGSSHSKTRGMSPFTPTRNECTRSLYGDGAHLGSFYPNYMCLTESSRAKVRSQSAPRQRMEWFESHGSSKRLYNYGNEFRMSRSYLRRNTDANGF